ncbi:MAG: hypothetical protein M3Y04_02065, partial [Actinomycetota bacterium]|nr:hypothetical protein [Actinomycetota bacterium]
MSRRPRLGAVAVGLALAFLAGGAPALAAGGVLAPVKESYRPGEIATLVGYTGGPAVTPVPTGRFEAYLRPAAGPAAPGVLASDVTLGPLLVRATGHRGFLALRASITFTVPADLDPGNYVVRYCDDPCTGATIGDLGPSPLSIGVDPVRPVAREWAFDDPEIADLAPGALIAGADFQATADDVRAGRVAPPPEPPPPAPLPAPTTDWTGPMVMV